MRHSKDTNHGHDTPGSPETPFWRAGLFYTLLTALLVWLSPMVMPWRTMFPDFICFWTAGKLLVEGASPYDRELQIRTQEEYGWDRMRDGQGVIDYLPFYYPPWFGLLFVPLV